jgi:hypothetical protein
LLTFRDPLTGKWVHAHWKAQVPVLQRRCEWEITGAPEIRHTTPHCAEPFNAFGTNAPVHAIIAPCCFTCADGAVRSAPVRLVLWALSRK